MNSSVETESHTNASSEQGRNRGHGQEPGNDSIFASAGITNLEQRRVVHIDPSLVYDLNLAHKFMLGRSSGLPSRPDFGTCGRAVRLRANHFPVHSIPDALYEYHVQITPLALAYSPHTARRIYYLAEQTTAWERAGMVGTVAHDGASRLVSSEPLPHSLEIQVHYHEEGTPPRQPNGRPCTLRIAFVQVLDMGNLIGYIQGRPGFRDHNISPAVSALNLIQLTARGDPLFDRLRFSATRGPAISLGGGLEAQREFTMTLLPARGQLTIRVEVGTTALYAPGNLATSIVAFRNFTMLPADRFVSHMSIQTTHLQSRRVVRRLAAENSDTLMVEAADIGVVSVRDYFSLKYGIHLAFPHLRLVELGPTVRLPPEICTILPLQPFRRRLPDVCAAAMMNVARVCANTNGHVIQQLGQQPVGPILSAFGMDIGSGMLEVPGRVLPKPAIVYSAKTAYVNNRGQWDPGDGKFIVGAHLDRWVVLVIKDGCHHPEFSGVADLTLREAVKAFRDICNHKGINITVDPIYTAVQLPPQTDADPVREVAVAAIRAGLVRNTPKPQAILVALASNDPLVYEGVKHLCDVLLDVATLCVLSSKFRASRPEYLSSLALKLNMKLGGINYKLDAKSAAWLHAAPTMVVGMDVVHPDIGCAYGMPSIAAVVASVDEHFAQYPASLSLLSRHEIINLTTMMIERLRFYQNQNGGKLPERILVYRKGLSEAHFNHLLSLEVPKIKDAFQSFDMPNNQYKPKLTIVVCRKSWRTWFWPDDTRSDWAYQPGDGENPEAGTVVDRGVTSAYNFDFYLQAHGGVAGTARPTLYTVIYDEIRVSADEVQGVTHALSYMYAPAMHAISLAAPAHYADLAGKRGRCYLRRRFYGYDDMAAEEATRVMREACGDIPGWGLSGTMFYI